MLARPHARASAASLQQNRLCRSWRAAPAGNGAQQLLNGSHSHLYSRVQGSRRHQAGGDSRATVPDAGGGAMQARARRTPDEVQGMLSPVREQRLLAHSSGRQVPNTVGLASPQAGSMLSCERCGAEFTSRNKLFKHLKRGCASELPEAHAGTTEPGGGSSADTELQLAQLVARLTAQQGGVMEAARVGVLLSTYHAALLKRYHREREGVAAGSGGADSSWLAACASAYPALLSLERIGELQVRCGDEMAIAAAAEAAADAGAGAVIDAEAATAAAQRLREKVCKKAACCQEGTEDGWIGVPWIVRGVEQRLAGYALLAPRADLARAADPGRFCLSTANEEQLARRNFRRRKGGVSWVSLTALLQSPL